MSTFMGGPDIFIAQPVVNLGAYRFGLRGDGVTPEDTALASAMTQAASIGAKLVIPPDVQIRLINPPVIPDVNGFIMEGDGKTSSVFYLDPGPESNKNGFTILSDLLNHRYAGFSVWGNNANPANWCWGLYSNVNAGGSGHQWDDVNVGNPNDAGVEFGKGWWLDPTGGQNSEYRWQSCWARCYSTAGWHFPGSEQYNLELEACAMNGGWNGVAKGLVGGAYGVWSQGGAFSANNCFGGAHNLSDFEISGFNGQPTIINNFNSEVSYGLLNAGDTLSPSAGVGSISVRRCRLAYGAGGVTFASDGVIKFPGAAGLVVDECTISAVGTPPANYPKIAVAPGGWPRGIQIRRNHFESQNSVAHDPLIIVGSFDNFRSCIDIRDNDYLDNSNQTAYRNESINTAPQALSFMQDSVQYGVAQDLWFMDLTTPFIANAASQTVTFMTIPGTMLTFEDFKALLINYVVVTGGATIALKIGTTSGGDELMASTTLGGSMVGDGGAVYGGVTTGLGTDMPNHVGVASYPNGSPPQTLIYVTATASAGHVGNGSVSNITRGLLHVMPVYRNAARFTA
jgi:hypothetical protein